MLRNTPIWWFGGVALLLLACIEMEIVAGSAQNKCNYPAIYNFGDSNSDTGGGSAALGEVPPPNGETFFGMPSGRLCNGRLIIDFLAENLGLPYLSAYLDSIATNFRHGANFAVGGSSILPGGYSPFHLDLQISQFIQFKSRTIALYKKLNDNTRVPPFRGSLPRPRDFSEALYTIDIGQNDIAHGFQYTNEKQLRASIPTILEKLSQAIHQLYTEGARNFWVHNTGPIGCLPLNVINYRGKPGNLDRNGCLRPPNKVAQEFNKQLKDRVSQLRAQLQGASLTYVDMYSAKYALITTAKPQGFDDPFKFCCGSHDGYQINCGKRVEGNGNLYGKPCSNPSKSISWDGIHYSETANLLIAKRILNGSLSDPPVSIAEACYNPEGV